MVERLDQLIDPENSCKTHQLYGRVELRVGHILEEVTLDKKCELSVYSKQMLEELASKGQLNQ
jgi:hypothetical protein